MKKIFALLMAWVGLMPVMATAQYVEGITASGIAKKSAPATSMQMLMVIEAKGADFKTALEALNAKQKEATIKLEKLDVLEDSIKFEPAESADGENAQQMMRMMRQRMGNDPRIAEMMKIKPPTVLRTTLTARWKIEGEGNELLLAVNELQEKINTSDIAGAEQESEEDEEMSDEQREFLEEMSEMQSYYSSDDSPAGTPVFQFSATFSLADYDQVMAEAFADAEKKAGELAKAANRKLGALCTLASSTSYMNDYDYDYDPYAARRRGSGLTKNANGVEVLSDSPRQVELTVSINTIFKIE